MKTTHYVAVALAFVLMTTAGCKTTNVFQGLTRKDREKPSTFAEDSSSSKGSKNTSPTALASSDSGAAGSTEQAVAAGQREIAAWYQDNSLGHLESAKKHFEQALKKKPAHADAHHGLAIVADLQKRYPDAERHYRQALTISPQNSQVLGDLGYSYLLQNRLAEAEQVLNQALGADSSNVNATKHLGDVYARQGKAQLAESMYRQVLSEADMAKALADNAPTAQNSNVQLASGTEEAGKSNSLISKLRPKKEESDLTLEIRKQMEEAKLAEQQRRQQSSQQQQMLAQQGGGPGAPSPSSLPVWAGNGSPNPQGQQVDPRDEMRMLQARLAQIESESYSRVPNGPVVIEDPRSRNAGQSLPGAQAPVEGWPVQGAYPPPAAYGAPGSEFSYQQPAAGSQPTWNSAPVVQGNSIPAGPSSPVVTPGQSPADSQNRPQWAAEMVTMSPRRNVDQSDPVTRPWGQVTQAGGPNMPQSIGQAQYQQSSAGQPGLPPEQSTNSPYYSDPRMAGNTSQGTGPGGNGAGPNPNSDLQAYEEAARAAARLGMGLGGASLSGQPPVASRNSAGTNSSWSGNSFGSPNRFLPTDAPPQDLNRAFAPQAGANMAPPAGTHGQFPSVNPPLRSNEQFGTASRYQPEGYQSNSIINSPAAPNLQQYEQQRQQADATLNGAMQQAWERPADRLVTPASGIAAPQGRQTPPPWPNRPVNPNPYEQPSAQAPDSSGQGPSQPGYDPGVVVPRSYPGRPTTGSSGTGFQTPSGNWYDDPNTRTSGYRPSQQAPYGYSSPAQPNSLPQVIPTR